MVPGVQSLNEQAAAAGRLLQGSTDSIGHPPLCFPLYLLQMGSNEPGSAAARAAEAAASAAAAAATAQPAKLRRHQRAAQQRAEGAAPASVAAGPSGTDSSSTLAAAPASVRASSVRQRPEGPLGLVQEALQGAQQALQGAQQAVRGLLGGGAQRPQDQR